MITKFEKEPLQYHLLRAVECQWCYLFIFVCKWAQWSLFQQIKGFDYAVLDSYAQFMSKAAQLLGIDMSGKVCLPTQIQKFTVLKSPFVYKKHRVQYELRTHVRLLQIRKVTGTTADIFLEYIQRNIPEGVNMSVYQESAEKPPQVLAQLLKDAKKKAKEAKLKN